MKTGVEDARPEMLDQTPTSGGDERLFIDLDVCSTKCPECTVQCSYFDLFDNNGIRSVAELVTLALVCRRCADPHCVKACPVGALEQDKDEGAMLVRHNMLCISCDSCSHACPYGTIYPEHVPLLTHSCDYCLDRRSCEEEPLCTRTCPYGALRLKRDDGELQENEFLVGEHLMARSTHWRRGEA